MWLGSLFDKRRETSDQSCCGTQCSRCLVIKLKDLSINLLIREFLAYIAETLIFVLAGIIIGYQVLYSDMKIEANDYYMLFGLYAGLHVIRFLTIFVLWPLLKITGYGMSFKEILVLSYGGLRGAVGLALALLVSQGDDIKDPKVKDLILFHTAGIATLTILINGNTTAFVIKTLGIGAKNKAQQQVMGSILKEFVEFTHKKTNNLKANKYYTLTDWYDLFKTP